MRFRRITTYTSSCGAPCSLSMALSQLKLAAAITESTPFFSHGHGSLLQYGRGLVGSLCLHPGKVLQTERGLLSIKIYWMVINQLASSTPSSVSLPPILCCQLTYSTPHKRLPLFSFVFVSVSLCLLEKPRGQNAAKNFNSVREKRAAYCHQKCTKSNIIMVSTCSLLLFFFYSAMHAHIRPWRSTALPLH